MSTTAISLDYDGCGSILFAENQENIVQFIFDKLKHLEIFQENQDALKANIEENIISLRAKLRQIIDDESKDSEHRILLVGSNRQDPATDLYNSVLQKNHRCFELFRKYSEQNGFNFCELLLGDIYDVRGNKRESPLPIGTTIQTSYPVIEDSLPRERLMEALKPHCLSPSSNTKKMLIQTQVDHIAESLKDGQEPTPFIFLDDRQDIIDSLMTQIKNNELMVPPNIRFKPIKFDFMEEFKVLFQQRSSNPIKRKSENPSLFQKKSKVESDTADSTNSHNI